MNPLGHFIKKAGKQVIKKTGKQVQKYAEKQVQKYIHFEESSKELILKERSVALLCKQIQKKIGQIKALDPDVNEGLVAVIEHENITVKVRFTPDKIIYENNLIRGELVLLDKPEVQSNSFLYSILISSWSIFLGGYIPPQVLPKQVKMDGNRIHYEFPQEQTKLLRVLFKTLKDGSALNLSLTQGELRIASEVGIDWGNLNQETLIGILQQS